MKATRVPGGARTRNLLIHSQTLHQLNYGHHTNYSIRPMGESVKQVSGMAISRLLAKVPGTLKVPGT